MLKVSVLLAENRITCFRLQGPNALKVGNIPGVWARNLLANQFINARLFLWNHTLPTRRPNMKEFNLVIWGTRILGLSRDYPWLRMPVRTRGILAATGGCKNILLPFDCILSHFL